MLTEITIPKLTLTMEGGTLLRWLKQEGARVAKDEALFELETDKAVTEVPSPVEGVLRTILIPEGEVQVGAVVGLVGELNDPIPEIAGCPVKPRPVADAVPSPAPSNSELGSAAPGVLRATPAAKRRAKELGVDLSSAQATGPEGRITVEDVECLAAQYAKSAEPQTMVGDLRPIIAEHVTRAWHAVPHIHIGGELKATGLREALEAVRRNPEAEISVTDLLLYSICLALPKVRSLNTVWEGEKPIAQAQIHLAFAIETERGVVAPVIHDADRLRLMEISAERRRLRQAALARQLKRRDVEGGTFTLTNLGMFPVDFFIPIINDPQSAILATGRIRDRVELHGGIPRNVPSLWANVAVDHRVADGATAAVFLRELQTAFDALEAYIHQEDKRR
ncbi:MAG TPA: dihydrolipoamide acetyltransferase family protein [Terriglobia bacterium]|nr:dihydrolipoamide acetyltransferase family protein [Terriglobia bacterium]